MVVVSKAVVIVGQAQRGRVEGVPAPGDAVRVEVSNEGRQVVRGRYVGWPVIAAPVGATTPSRGGWARLSREPN